MVHKIALLYMHSPVGQQRMLREQTCRGTAKQQGYPNRKTFGTILVSVKFSPSHNRLRRRGAFSLSAARALRKAKVVCTSEIAAEISGKATNARISALSSGILFVVCTIAACIVGWAHQPWPALFLVAVEAAYVGLHVRPLMPLVQEDRINGASRAFMQCYTTPQFFATELLLFYALLRTRAWSQVPLYALGVHAGFHALYTILSGLMPNWTVQQNIQRVQGLKPKQPWRAAWDTILNILNGADTVLHVWYIILLIKAVSRMEASGSRFLHIGITTCIAVSLAMGCVLYFILGEWAPKAMALAESTLPD
eukprot:jgi/Botrbrau1/20805/Bobra.0156s0034.1